MTKIDAKRRYRASAGGSVRQKQSFKGSILLLFGISLTLSPAFAQAQEFDIDAGPAVAGLSEFAAQADVSVVYTYDAVDGLETNKVEGVYEPDQALQLLLAGTGLSVYEGEGGAFAVAARDGGGDSDSKNLNPAPVLMAQNQTSQTSASAETSSRSSDGGTSIVIGKVTDARTGANLKGAKVTIEETGQWTSSNDLGEFRFVNVPTGSVTITVSFLGYAGQSAVVGVRGNAVSQSFALRGGSEIEEIVVFGQRSARAIALNQERTAKNFTTVLASDFLGNFTGDTISEALRLAPGVAFQQDPLTGEGTNIIIRGLEPDLNTVTLNGLRLPEGSGLGRSPDLGNILTESISKVTISKTLLPSQDSTGTGGLIEIETKSPLDRERRFFNLGVGGIRRSGEFGDGFFASGTISSRLGANENLGISVSAQYRDAETRSVSYNVRSLYNPVGPGLNGQPTVRAFIDPTTPFPFDAQFSELYPETAIVGDSRVSFENFSIGSTLAYNIADHTSLRFDAQYFDETRTTFETFQNTTAFIVGGRDVPIDELGGEVRTVATWEDGVTSFGLPGFLISTGRDASYVPDSKTDTLALGISGNTTNGEWEFVYEGGYAQSGTSTPQSFDISTSSNGTRFFGFEQIPENFISDAAFENIFDDRVVALYSARPRGALFPTALLSDAGFATFNDPANYQVSGASFDENRDGDNERWTGKFSIARNFGHGFIRKISAGVFYEESTYRSGTNGATGTIYRALQQGLVPYGLTFSDATTGAIGVDSTLAFGGLSEASVIDLVQSLNALSSGENSVLLATPLTFDERNRDALTEETEISTYVEVEAQIGKLELIGGLRAVNVEARAVDTSNSVFIDDMGVRDLQFQEDSAILFDESATQTEVLPRFLGNYRLDEDNILRFGYFATVARPQIRLLSAPQSISLDLQPRSGPNRDQPRLFIRESNPDLEPAYTHNFDLSFETYSQVGTVQVSLFYKEIKNLLQSNSDADLTSLDDVRELPDHPRFALDALPDNLFIDGSRPANSPDTAEIWGIELAAERQLTFLPGGFSGLGVFANYTYTDSERSDVIEFRFAPIDFDAQGRPIAFERQLINVQVPFASQPEHSGTAALTYNRHDIDASLSYSVQSRRLVSGLEQFRLNQYEDKVDTLDLRAEYRLEASSGAVRFFAEILDLLNDEEEAALTSSLGGNYGVPRYNVGGRYFGGRSIQFGVAATF